MKNYDLYSQWGEFLATVSEEEVDNMVDFYEVELARGFGYVHIREQDEEF